MSLFHFQVLIIIKRINRIIINYHEIEKLYFVLLIKYEFFEIQKIYVKVAFFIK